MVRILLRLAHPPASHAATSPPPPCADDGWQPARQADSYQLARTTKLSFKGFDGVGKKHKKKKSKKEKHSKKEKRSRREGSGEESDEDDVMRSVDVKSILAETAEPRAGTGRLITYVPLRRAFRVRVAPRSTLSH